MKATTAAQMTNAVAAAMSGKGRAVWVVSSRYSTAAPFAASKAMTYREACAKARSIREACGYASIARVA